MYLHLSAWASLHLLICKVLTYIIKARLYGKYPRSAWSIWRVEEKEIKQQVSGKFNGVHRCWSTRRKKKSRLGRFLSAYYRQHRMCSLSASFSSKTKRFVTFWGRTSPLVSLCYSFKPWWSLRGRQSFLKGNKWISHLTLSLLMRSKTFQCEKGLLFPLQYLRHGQKVAIKRKNFICFELETLAFNKRGQILSKDCPINGRLGIPV